MPSPKPTKPNKKPKSKPLKNKSDQKPKPVKKTKTSSKTKSINNLSINAGIVMNGRRKQVGGVGDCTTNCRIVCDNNASTPRPNGRIASIPHKFNGTPGMVIPSPRPPPSQRQGARNLSRDNRYTYPTAQTGVVDPRSLVAPSNSGQYS